MGSMTSPSRTGTPQDAPEPVAIEGSDGVASANADADDGVAGPVEDASGGATSIFSSLAVLDGASPVDCVVGV